MKQPTVGPGERLKVRSSFCISLVLLAGAVLEVVKNSVIAYRYGSGAETDAFFAAYVVPTTYAMFWLSSCLVGLVPLLAVWLKQSDKQISDISGAIIALSATSTAALASVAYLSAHPVMKLLVPGFNEAQQLQAVHLFRQLTPLFVLAGLIGVASAVLNSRRQFLLPSSQKIVVNSVILVGLSVWGVHMGIQWVATLTVLGTLLYAWALLVRMCKAGARLKLRWALNRWETQTLLAAIFMPFAAGIARQSSILAERTVGSFLPAGSISELTYAFQVVMGFSAVIVAGVTTTLMPTLAQESSNSGKLRLIQQGFHYLLVAVLPLAFGVFLLARPLVLILFHHGAFSAANVAETTKVFQAYAFGILFATMAVLFQAPLLADRRYSLVISHNALMGLLNIILDLLLAPFLGVAGLALGYTLTSAASCLRLAWQLERRYGSFWTRTKLSSAAKPLVATLPMAIIVVALRSPVSALALSQVGQFYNEIFRTVVLAGVGTVTYVAGGIAGRMEPFPTMYRTLRSRLATLLEGVRVV
jgi:putative peptidoglycan lipid II flippase